MPKPISPRMKARAIKLYLTSDLGARDIMQECGILSSMTFYRLLTAAGIQPRKGLKRSGILNIKTCLIESARPGRKHIHEYTTPAIGLPLIGNHRIIWKGKPPMDIRADLIEVLPSDSEVQS